MECVDLKISGFVHGISFRRGAKQVADSLGLTGWIKNTDQGIEAYAVGPKEKLDQFIDWCKKGPPAAKVEGVEVKWSKVDESAGGFEIIW